MVTFINGLTASAVTSPSDWPAAMQIEQLRLQLELLRQWAKVNAADLKSAQSNSGDAQITRRAG